MFYKENSSTNPSTICNLFASFFSEVYVPSHFDSTGNSRNPPVYHAFFDVDEVRSMLLQIDIKKGSGPDGIPPVLLRNCADALAYPLSFIFNLSLSQSYFPLSWKTSYIQPIHKSGLKTNIENYRGIAILSAIPKLLEKLVFKKMFHGIKHQISPKQHGFFSGRSTVSNLSELTHYVSNSLKVGKQVEIIYTDFSKAFDKINHEKLLVKLSLFGNMGIPVDWIKSYLTNRNQTVLFHGIESNRIQVTSGVPQGSHLGPLLFILFINNVVDCLKYSEVLLYADDIKIFKTINDIDDLLNFQKDLDSFSEWVNSNLMLLNVSKCKHMTFKRSNILTNGNFTLNNIIVENVNKFADLGVLFNDKLNFTLHIDNCIAKANSMLGFIKRFSKDFSDPYTIKSLYISFVRSHLEYASVIWNPFYENASNRIESVQKRFLIYALRRLPRNETLDAFVLPSYRSRCLLLNIEPLHVRRSVSAVLFIFDVLTGKFDCPNILSRISIYTPHSMLRPRPFSIRLEYSASNFGKSEPIYNASRLFNTVFEIFDFNITRDQFKRRAVDFFLNYRQ